MRPWPFIAAGVLLVLLGAIVTTDLLKALGPMRRSLESADELSRRVAELEVLAFRLFALVLGAGALGLGVFWSRVCRSHWVGSIWAHPAESAPAFDAKTIMTMPFVLLASGVVGFLALMNFGPGLIGEEQVIIWSLEDGLGQQLTAYVFILAGVVALVAAHHEESKQRKFWTRFLGIGFLLCAGEEASWGQRIFDFGTPEVIGAINVQNETNIHNMFGYSADHLFIALVFFYGAILPLVAGLYPFINKLCDRIGLPVASPGLAVGFFLVSLFHNWTIQHFILPPADFRIEEVREFLSSIGLLLLMCEAYRRAVSHRSASNPSSIGDHMLHGRAVLPLGRRWN